MNFVEGCAKCRQMSESYEAVTLDWFRVQSQLGIAEFLRDADASAGIVAELDVIAKHRKALRRSASLHIEESHAARAARN